MEEFVLKKIMATHMLKHHQCHIHIWEVALMISHSYLVHFELVQICCLSSYAMDTLYFDHTRTRHLPLSVMSNLAKARHPPETNKKESESSCSWILVRVKKRERKGKDDKSKSIADGQVSLFTHAHDQSTWMAWLLRDILFEPAK